MPLSSDSLSCCNYCGPSISEVSEKRTQAVQCWRRWKTLQGKWWQIGCHLQPFTHGYLAYFLCNSSSLSTRLMPSCYYSSAVTRGRRVYRISGLYRSRKQICRALDKSVSFHSPKPQAETVCLYFSTGLEDFALNVGQSRRGQLGFLPTFHTWNKCWNSQSIVPHNLLCPCSLSSVHPEAP